MRHPETEVLSTLLFIGLCWLIIRYYWLRILSAAIGLALWGAVAIGVPVFFVVKYVRNGQFIVAFIALAASIIPAGLWVPAGMAAVTWIQKQRRFGQFWQPWNAT